MIEYIKMSCHQKSSCARNLRERKKPMSNFDEKSIWTNQINLKVKTIHLRIRGFSFFRIMNDEFEDFSLSSQNPKYPKPCHHK